MPSTVRETCVFTPIPGGFEPSVTPGYRVRWGRDDADRGGMPLSVRATPLLPGLILRCGRRLVVRVQDRQGQPLTENGKSVQWRIERLGFRTATMVSLVPVRDGASLWMTPEAWDADSLFLGPMALEFTAEKPLGEMLFLADCIGESDVVAHFLDVPKRVHFAVRRTTSGGGGDIGIVERFSGTIAPLPPPLVFALRHNIRCDFTRPATFTTAMTAYGPYAYAAGNVLRCRLPDPAHLPPSAVRQRYAELFAAYVGEASRGSRL